MPPPAARRLNWPDTARGIAILAVVIFHGVAYCAAVGYTSVAWTVAVDALATFRMPLFFFVSGMLARSAINRSWRDLTVQRIVFYLWTYWLWWSCTFAIDAILPKTKNMQTSDPLLWLRGFAIPTNDIWYLYALALFVILGKLVVRLPTWAVIVAPSVIAVPFGAGALTTSSWVGDNIVIYTVFFMIGVRLGGTVLKATARTEVSFGLSIAIATAFAALTWAIIAYDLLSVPLVRLAASAVAIAVGVFISIAWGDIRLLGWLSTIGRQTLPIYVTHQSLMAVAALALGLARDTGLRSGLILVGPILLTVVVVPIALLLGHVFGKVPGLFAPPRWVELAVGRAFSFHAMKRDS